MAYQTSLKHKRDVENTYSIAQRFGHDQGLREGLVQGMRIGIEKGFERGIRKGIEKGRAEEILKAAGEKRNTALKLKERGLLLEDIAYSTGFTITEIEKM